MSCTRRLQFFITKLRVENYELNHAKEFSKLFARLNFETATC